MPACVSCAGVKPDNEFSFRNDNKKFRSSCNKCRASEMAAKRYGVTVGEIDALRISQDNRCAICQKHIDEIKHESFKHNPLVIDHDHSTGRVRGLLCSKCNTLIGQADESIPTLLNAIKYLSTWTE